MDLVFKKKWNLNDDKDEENLPTKYRNKLFALVSAIINGQMSTKQKILGEGARARNGQ